MTVLQLESQVQSLKKQLESLTESAGDAVKLTGELEKANETVKRLKYDLQQARSERASAVKELSDLKAEVGGCMRVGEFIAGHLCCFERLRPNTGISLSWRGKRFRILNRSCLERVMPSNQLSLHLPT